MYDSVIHGRVLQDGSLKEVYIYIDESRISKITYTRPSSGEYGELHSFGKKLILPGIIDTHVHMRDPGLTQKEDLYTGSVSAAFGGVTAFIDMPNTIPPTMDAVSFMQKVDKASSKVVVDHAFNLCVRSDTSLDDVDAILSVGDGIPKPIGLKAFMGESTGSLTYGPFEDLGRWGPIIKHRGIPLSIHAEDGDLFRKGDLKRRTLLQDHSDSRPPESEASAIVRTNDSMGSAAPMLHLLHISSEAGLAAASGKASTIEVTPHHLILDIKNAEKMLDHQGLAKVNPPIRRTSDRAALLRAVNEGSVLTMGSDHAPHTMEDKIESDPPPSGMPGIETMLPLMLDMVSRRKVDLQRVIEILCSNPAKRFGLKDRGAILPGMMADIVVVDRSSTRRIRGEELHSKCGWTPYEGMEGIFPEAVFSRGELIIDNDMLVGKAGRGRYLV